jgi:3-oxoacyl-[acyl-carrier-protein] synthase II
MGREVWITGIGLTSSVGEGLDAHWRALAEANPPVPVIDTATYAPFPVFPMAPVDLDQQIPRKGDQRQMEPWQRIGTYAAGLALSDAGLAGDLDRLSQTHVIVAAGGGERDLAVDSALLRTLKSAQTPEEVLNERLANDLRPTLFLAQLPNLLAGNISIVHKVTGSSRTFMGEEIAGVGAVEIAWRRIAGGQGDIFLVGGASIAERSDVLFGHALGRTLWAEAPISVWKRPAKGGGAILGSMSAFLVLEAREIAEARGRRPYARLGPVLSDQSLRRPGEAAGKGQRQFDAVLAGSTTPAAVLSGATGLALPTSEEQDLLATLIEAGRVSTVRGVANLLGSGIEATFPMLLGLGALALSRKGFYASTDETGFETAVSEPPRRIVATTWGLWRGEGAALVEAVD